MTYDDIVKLLSNPSKVAEGLVALDEYNKELTGERDTLKTKNEALEGDKRDLQDSNMKLYLRITGKADAKDEEEDTRDAFQKLVDKARAEKTED